MKDTFPSGAIPADERLSSGVASSSRSGPPDDAGSSGVPPWESAEALVEIRRLVAAGLTTRQIGERWGVSRNAVQKRLERQREKARLGVKHDASLPDWRSEEARVEVLRLRREGRKPVEIARMFGVSTSAVFRRLSALPEDYEPRRRAPVPEIIPEWGAEEAAKVAIALREGGWRLAEIAALFGVTDNAVCKRFRRLAAGGRKRGEADNPTSDDNPVPGSRTGRSSERSAVARGRDRHGGHVASGSSGGGTVVKDRTASLQEASPALSSWHSPNIDDELRRLHGSGMPLTEIARRFGVARSTLRDRLVRLGIITAPGSSPRQESGDEQEAETTMRELPQEQDIVGRSPLDVASLIVPSACRWPMWGDDERPTHVYCGKPALRAKWPGVYCEDCRAKAFRRIAVMEEA